MDSPATLQSDNVTPPTGVTTPGDGITVLTVATTADSFDLYDANGVPYPGFFDRYITLTADGGKLWYSFTDATQTVNEAITSTTTVAAGTTAVTCQVLNDGLSATVRLTEGTHRWLNVKSASGTIKLRVHGSSQRLVSRSFT